MKHPEYRFVTNLPCDEVMTIVSKQKMKYFFHNGIVGKSSGTQIEIGYMSYHRNPWSPVFHGYVSNCSDRTLITGVLKVDSTAKILMRVLRYILIFVPLPILLGVILTDLHVSTLLFSIIPLFMCALTFVTEQVYIGNGNNDEYEILRFIKKVLVATPVTVSAGSK